MLVDEGVEPLTFTYVKDIILLYYAVYIQVLLKYCSNSQHP